MSYRYRLVRVSPDHPKARYPGRGRYGWADEHVIIAEQVLGKPLPPNAEIHHVDNNPRNNAHNNLVLCQDHTYHLLLHLRQRALDACGHGDWRRCKRCKKWSPPNELSFFRRCGRWESHETVHAACNAQYQRDRKARLRAEKAQQ